MGKKCTSCGHEKETEAEGVIKHLRDVMEGRGHAHFQNTLQGLEESDYCHEDTTEAEADAIQYHCREYEAAIQEAFTAFGKVLVAAGIPLDEAKDWVSGYGGNEEELDEVRVILAKARLGAKK